MRFTGIQSFKSFKNWAKLSWYNRGFDQSVNFLWTMNRNGRALPIIVLVNFSGPRAVTEVRRVPRWKRIVGPGARKKRRRGAAPRVVTRGQGAETEGPEAGTEGLGVAETAGPRADPRVEIGGRGVETAGQATNSIYFMFPFCEKSFDLPSEGRHYSLPFIPRRGIGFLSWHGALQGHSTYTHRN